MLFLSIGRIIKKLLKPMALALLIISCEQQNTSKTNAWLQLQEIVDSVVVPAFPNKIFNILDYGAITDSTTNNTDAIKKAIEACSLSGGGIVLIPKGKFLTGPIHLENNINLHLNEGAEILFSTNLDDFPIVHTSYEGTELMNFSPLIYAKGKTNIAITGKGILNGQASNDFWWSWCGKESYGWKDGDPKQHTSLTKLKEGMSEKGVPVEKRVFGKGEYLRPSFVEPFECNNVLIQGVKIINAPFWVIHPIKSTNVTIDGVTVESHGPNNDGCDPEYSKNIIIKNCTFNTGDDCIAIKSGRNEDGRRVNIVSENIVVQNCKMIDGHGGVVMGSEISAGVRNVFVENCEMDSPNLERAIRIKTNTKRGGFVEDVYVRNIKIGQVKEAVLKINLFYGIYGVQEGEFMPRVSNINLENIQVENGGKYGILAKGYAEQPITDITLKDVTIKKVDSVYALENVTNINFINTHINGIPMKSL
ncbi:glycoside hydrolase family 28 protein [Maribacter sp. CXY002]|uniref:glycoside hydrolase family 28 protein n=1 Tax=Maribacter luteocoastalis TaxID=3407671 RepID=UPI003B6822FA